jgi:hypothetical protein
MSEVGIICAGIENICADIGNICAGIENICADIGNICAGIKHICALLGIYVRLQGVFEHVIKHMREYWFCRQV